jgi:uncharacterized membrane protein YeiH
MPDATELLRLTDLMGVAVFAVSGALAAGRKSLDLLGVVVIATVTAIGGGTTRDVLLDRHPVFWIADPAYLAVIAVVALGTVAWYRRYRVPGDALAIADALGLAFFVIGGAQIAEALALPAISVIVMGVITGTFGGVVRDVLTNEIPLIFRRGELYATTAIAGVAGYLLLAQALPRPAAALMGMAIIVGLRLASILWGLRLPVFTLPEDRG